MVRKWLMRRFCGSRILQYANFTLTGTVNDAPVRVPIVAGLGMMPVPLWEQEPWLNRIIALLLAESAKRPFQPADHLQFGALDIDFEHAHASDAERGQRLVSRDDGDRGAFLRFLRGVQVRDDRRR